MAEFGDPLRNKEKQNDQILVSVCCPPRNEHTVIKKLQIVMSGLGYFKKMPKMTKKSCSSSSHSASHLFVQADCQILLIPS